MRSFLQFVKFFYTCYRRVTARCNTSHPGRYIRWCRSRVSLLRSAVAVRFQPFPDPARDIFAGGVFQAGDIVQVVVIQLLVDRLETGF